MRKTFRYRLYPTKAQAEALTGLANFSKAGYPRFKPHQRFDSITFPSYGDGIRLLDSGKLRVQGVGAVKVKLHRPVEGMIKTVSLKREAGWSGFFSKLAYKAESAGRLLVQVDPRGTSQRCSGCGGEVRKELKDRWHACSTCGLSVSRDHNSALEILRLGRSLVAPTWGISPCVATEAVGF